MRSDNIYLVKVIEDNIHKLNRPEGTDRILSSKKREMRLPRKFPEVFYVIVNNVQAWVKKSPKNLLHSSQTDFEALLICAWRYDSFKFLE